MPSLNAKERRDDHDHLEAARGVTGGVDTHLDVHVAAALDSLGGLLGTESFATDSAGYKALLGWLERFGDVTRSASRARVRMGLGWPVICVGSVSK